MDPWLKLKFQKHPEIKFWDFLSVFSVSKCHHSPRFRIFKSKLDNFWITLTEQS